MPQSLTQLTRSLCVAQSAFYLTNTGIFVDAGQALLIDPGLLPSEIQAIRARIAEQAALPQAIVLTHCHWDHILGPERFPGVRTVAHAAFPETARGKRGTRIRRQVDEWERHQAIGRTTPFVIPKPDRTFVEKKALDVGRLALQLIHAPGHAADQLVAYEPGSGALWAADMLSDLEIPYVGHSLVAYERTLATLSTLAVQVLVPGHGRATMKPEEIRSRFTADMAYLGELHERVERAVRGGKMAEETVERCVDMQFAHPEENEKPHRMNIESVYLELGGEADASNIGWDRLSTRTE